MNNEEVDSPRFGGEIKKDEAEIIEKIQTFELNPKTQENLSQICDNKHKNEANFQLSITEIQKDEKELKYYTWEEIKKHNNSKSLWMVLNGKVFDLTKYLPQHPGGEAKLLKGAGIDATSLFNKYHRWVNYNIMVGKLHIGYVKKD